jgi:hypothetical protein
MVPGSRTEGVMAEPSGRIPVGQAARLLMISEERIRQLVKQGYVSRSEKRGYVQLVGAVQGYLRYLKDDELATSPATPAVAPRPVMH